MGTSKKMSSPSPAIILIYSQYSSEKKLVANVYPRHISMIVAVSSLCKTTQKKMIQGRIYELLDSLMLTGIFAMVFLDRVLGNKCKGKYP